MNATTTPIPNRRPFKHFSIFCAKFIIASAIGTALLHASGNGEPLVKFGKLQYEKMYQSLYPTQLNKPLKNSDSDRLIQGAIQKTSTQDMAKFFFQEGRGFLALAILTENGGDAMPDKPFLDQASTLEHPQVDIGFGYNITKRLGDAKQNFNQVQQELLNAGFNQSEVEKLLSSDKEDYEQVTVTTEQSIRLLMLTEKEYQNRARSFVSNETWKTMPQHQKDGLTYLAYNADIEQFKNLKVGLQTRNLSKILHNLDVCYPQNGKDVLNVRLTGYLIHTMASPHTAKEVIFNPIRTEVAINKIFDAQHINKKEKFNQAIRMVKKI